MKQNTLLLLIVLVFSSSTSNLFSQGAPACPSITAIADDTVCLGDCTNLGAAIVSNNQTTSYVVDSIPYGPYPYVGGTGVSVGTDDVWSPVINIGFTFCYFGNSFNQLIIGSNGNVTFNLANASGYNAWQISANLPSAANTPGNTICATFRDLDPSDFGNVRYYTTGTAPCRALVIYWDSVALYSCSTPASTFQLVLYETTNFIDVYVQKTSGSCSWNSGKGIIGIQNSNATVAVCPPGRNNTTYTTANEAWRFSPTGAPSYSVTWTDPNGVIGTGTSPISVCPTATTTYTATMLVYNCDSVATTVIDSVTVVVSPGPKPVANLGNDTIICSNQQLLLDATNANATYQWQNSSSAATYNVTSQGTYWVVVRANGCKDSDTMNVMVINPMVNLGPDTALCVGQQLLLNATNPSATYLWQNASTAPTYTVLTPGTYWAEATISGCKDSDTINVAYNPIPVVNLGNDTVLCNIQQLLLNAGNPGASYQWQNSSTAQTFTVTTQGTYWVQVTANGCKDSDTISISRYNPIVNLGADTALCAGDQLLLNATNTSGTYQWQSGATTPTYTVTSQGAYWAEVTINGCKDSDTINVAYNAYPVVNFGPDALLCLNTTLVLNAQNTNASYFWQDNSSNATYTVASPGNYWVEVISNGCRTVDSIEIDYELCDPILILPNVFSPNNDGINDLFMPVNIQNVVTIHTDIYNRWGIKVAESDKNYIEWDGLSNGKREVSDGTYYYIIKYTDRKNKEHTVTGFISLFNY